MELRGNFSWCFFVWTRVFRSVFGNFGGKIQSLFGGQLSLFVELCEKAREEAFYNMVNHANQASANAIICMRYDANEVMTGITEVLCYGTAVIVEQAD